MARGPVDRDRRPQRESEGRGYDIIRQFAGTDEVLQQHVVRVAMNNGMRGEAQAAVYFRFAGDLIDRIEEYANFVPGHQGNAKGS